MSCTRLSTCPSPGHPQILRRCWSNLKSSPDPYKSHPTSLGHPRPLKTSSWSPLNTLTHAFPGPLRVPQKTFPRPAESSDPLHISLGRPSDLPKALSSSRSLRFSQHLLDSPFAPLPVPPPPPGILSLLAIFEAPTLTASEDSATPISEPPGPLLTSSSLPPHCNNESPDIFPPGTLWTPLCSHPFCILYANSCAMILP